MDQREIEKTLRHFEGLVRETASQIVACGVEMEFDDVRQALSVKVWQAVQAFDERKAAAGEQLGRPGKRTQLERFVFMCVANARKDMLELRRRYNGSIDEIRARRGHSLDQHSDRFDARYLSVDADEVFAEIEREELTLPPTLTPEEHRLVQLMLEGRLIDQIERELGLSRGQRKQALRSAREKLAEWLPEVAPRRVLTLPPPAVEPQEVRAPVALAS